MAIRLSVNLNKVALLRNSRGGSNPDPVVAAETVLDAGADGVTLHWREDERHTREADVRAFAELARARGAELNLEGDLRAEMIELAVELRPAQFTAVPVTPGEITSDHGWSLPSQHDVLAPVIARLNDAGIRTSIFMDPVPDAMPQAAATGAQRVEIYTEPYAAAFHEGRAEAELERLRETARAAVGEGLGVNAGHDLDLRNLPPLARAVPEIAEVSIGHALQADALYLGLTQTVSRYLAACRGEAVTAPRTC